MSEDRNKPNPNYRDAKPTEREIWDQAVQAGKREPRPELTDNRPAIRAALRASRMRHTVRVRSHWP